MASLAWILSVISGGGLGMLLGWRHGQAELEQLRTLVAGMARDIHEKDRAIRLYRLQAARK